jgi:hypothetical protein
MASTPRRTIDPSYVEGMSCPICGQDGLQLKAMERYPDYVACTSCESQFVLEDDGERVMYGKIPAAYPRTQRFALQQWAWPEAIARRAAEERPAVTSQPPSPIPTPPTPESDELPDLPDQADTSAVPLGTGDEEPEPIPLPPEAPAEQRAEPPAEFDESATMIDDAEAGEAEPGALSIDESEFDLMADAGGGISTDDFDTSLAAPIEPAEDLPPEGEGEPAFELEWEQTVPPGEEAPAEPAWDEEPAAEAAGFSEADSAEADQAPSGATLSGTSEGATEPEPTEDWFAGEPEDVAAAEQDQDLLDSVFEPFAPGEQPSAPAEGASPGPWAQAEGGGESETSPPFAEEALDAGTPDLLPGETEPAPPMPDWLQTSDEPTAEPGPEPDESPGPQREDLLDSIWGDEQETTPEDRTGPDVASGLGIGALGALDAAEEEEPAEEPALTSDLWGDSDAAAPSFEDESMLGEPEPGRVAPFEMEEEPEAGALDQPVEETGPSQEEIAEMYWTGEVHEKEPAAEEAAAAPTDEGEQVGLEPNEPEPGIRYRVVTQTSQAVMPDDMCAHCNQSPTVSRLPIAATVFQGSGLGERQTITYRVPLCASCTERAHARSEEQQTARLQAHLISILVAMILVVGALGFRVVTFQDSIGFDLAILLLLAAMGYIVPAAFLLIRASRFPQPEDSKYVESTLRVPADTEGTETAFEWRNQTYARDFVAANQEQAVSGAMKVREREYEGP